jgi:serine/threonine protein kinase
MGAEQDTAPVIGPADPNAPSAAPGQVVANAASAPVRPPPLPAVVGGKYRPVRLIAKGGMGAVYEVVHMNTGEHLALKLMLARSLLTPDLRERFRREARIHSAVKSDHVVRVIDADVAHDFDDVPFLVMELLEGRDLERICQEGRPTPVEVVDWMRQLALALDKAHKEGIVHRDLKPENVFLAEREGQPPIIKVLDFGVAKTAFETDGHATATGQILGTPRYMAPEQATDAKQITAAADRFALGLIAFRLLSGRHYFVGDNWMRLLREVARGARERPSSMGCDRGAAFDAWFARSCAHAPSDRFATCAEQVEALARALEPRVADPRWHRPRYWLAAVAACAVITALAVRGFSSRREKLSSPPPITKSASPPTPPPSVPATPSVPAPASDTAVDPIPAAQARLHRADGSRPRTSPPTSGAHVKRGSAPGAPDHVWDEP